MTKTWAKVGGAAIVAMVVTACAPASPGSSPSSTDAAAATSGEAAAAPAAGEDTTLSLVGYAVPKAANNAIQELWSQTDEGAGVTWTESYGASGDQSRAVESGLDADYVHFSLEGDVTRLVDAGLVDADWNEGEHGGIVSSSVVVFAVRPGNPLGVDSWDDLIADGVEIVTPNPGSSGSARWNILAGWGQVIADGGSEEDAKEYTSALFDNVVALPGSGRDATSAFLSGTGDVLLSYENEAILAKQEGEEIDYVLPDTTLRIDNPGAVLKDADPRAEAWLDFLYAPEAQGEFAKLGFRPVIDGVEVGEVEGANDPADPFPAPAALLTIDDDFGGWEAANPEFFDPDTGIITQIQVETGKSS
ncbi:sulfate ABC transporter substrate-binding protein [Demequina sp. NBRC 110055]|uniref:sulfate ABC transporter substrate-binding protein n=1 Tax=Demequina sp. NBRC 110055 TaxID=1570344 RepID=UPI000A01EF53|nr:sulfate ABC transporter substrate-binding protein [Demequina sp. NBRC 110055]